MILQIAAFLALALWYVALRPRKGGKNAPPTVAAKNGVPIIGVLLEFFKSPNTMVQRCVKDYGSVFTIPVRAALRRCCVVVLCCAVWYHSSIIGPPDLIITAGWWLWTTSQSVNKRTIGCTILTHLFIIYKIQYRSFTNG